VLDLRMLMPALVAWAVCAATLGTRPVVLVCVAAGCALLSAGLTWRPVRRLGHLTTLVIAAVGLVCAATAGHTGAREAGPVRTLAEQHAVVRVVGVVTKDPVLVRGAQLDGSTVRFTMRLREVTGRGRVASVSTPVLVVADERW
jgi:competence protein ComEC